MSSLELTKDGGHGLPHDVREDIEPSPVWHPDDETVRPELAGSIDGVLECGNNGLSSIESESLGGIEFIC